MHTTRSLQFLWSVGYTCRLLLRYGCHDSLFRKHRGYSLIKPCRDEIVLNINGHLFGHSSCVLTLVGKKSLNLY